MTIPSPPDPEDELLERIAQQEASAVEWFYKTFLRPVRARLHACGLSDEECEDLVVQLVERSRQLREQLAALGLLLRRARRAHQLVAHRPGADPAGPAHDERDVQPRVVERALGARQAVAVVGPEEDDGVLQQPVLLQLAKKAGTSSGSQVPTQPSFTKIVYVGIRVTAAGRKIVDSSSRNSQPASPYSASSCRYWRSALTQACCRSANATAPRNASK